jgi:hypothetical protein
MPRDLLPRQNDFIKGPIRDLQTRVFKLEHETTLGSSSCRAGTTRWKDSGGVDQVLVGLLPDGTYGILVPAGTTQGPITSSGEVKGTDFKATGVNGLGAARLAGSTTGGGPGYSVATDDIVVDPLGKIWLGLASTWYSVAKPVLLVATTLSPASSVTSGTVVTTSFSPQWADSTVLIVASGEASISTASTIQLQVKVDTTVIATMSKAVAAGFVGQSMTLPPAYGQIANLAISSHSLSVAILSTNTSCATTDSFGLMALEIPK